MSPDRSLPSRPDLSWERRLLKRGFDSIAGIDEVGRGAWAGPVVAAAVCLPVRRRGLTRKLEGVRDSKQMTPRTRLAWDEVIRQVALAWAVGHATVDEIDALGVGAATRLAMARAVEGLGLQPDHLLIDYVRLPGLELPQACLIQGDRRSLSIAAASVVAKVHRDRWLARLDDVYAGYAFSAHKGYGTSEHRQALRRLGPSPVHRRSFAPVAALCPQPTAYAEAPRMAARLASA